MYHCKEDEECGGQPGERGGDALQERRGGAHQLGALLGQRQAEGGGALQVGQHSRGGGQQQQRSKAHRLEGLARERRTWAASSHSDTWHKQSVSLQLE